MLTKHCFHILAVGKNKDSFITEGIQNYSRNIHKYCSVEWIYCREGSSGSPEKKIEEEISSIETTLKNIKSSQIILLTEKAKPKNSVETARDLKKWMEKSLHPCFVIGGAFGFNEEFLRKFPDHLSLGPLTFNHQLVRLILSEQIYRCLSILHKSSYHHG